MYALPVFSNVEGPLECQMGLVVIIDKRRDCCVMATGNHSTWGIFLGD
jgi:hypothetical protein